MSTPPRPACTRCGTTNAYLKWQHEQSLCRRCARDTKPTPTRRTT